MSSLWLENMALWALPQVPKLANAVLVVLIGLAMSQLFWSVWPTNTPALPEAPITFHPGKTTTEIDMEAIASAHLFGMHDGNAIDNDSVIDAPETRLDLTLTGIISGSADARSWAFIREEDAQDESAYTVGDALAEGVHIHTIYPERVILARHGRFETLNLTLDKVLWEEPEQPVKTADPDLTIQELHKRIVADPRRFIKYANARPYYRNDRLQGFRIYPTSEGRKYFEQLGLEPGTLIRSINGLPLNGTVQLVHVGHELKQATHLSLVVGRDEMTQTVTINLR